MLQKNGSSHFRTINCTIIGRLSHPINADIPHCSVVHVKMFIALISFTIFRLYCFQAVLSLSMRKKLNVMLLTKYELPIKLFNRKLSTRASALSNLLYTRLNQAQGNIGVL